MKRKFSIFPLMAAMVLMTACGSRVNNEELPEPSEGNSISLQETQGEPETEEKPETPETQIIYEYEVSELPAVRDGNRIYGMVYVPQDAGEKMPTVIYSHPYGATHEFGTDYAEALAERGYVVYCFDFCGGSYSSQSDGSNLEMSLFTEQSDLEAVMSMLRGQPYVADSLVPVSISEKAADAYPSARLEVIPGAGHGFHGDALQQSIALLLDYMKEHTG